MSPIATSRSRQRGYEILEFGLMAVLLVPAFLWVFINGMNMIRLIQCNQICRDVGNLYMQGVDFTTFQAQTLATVLAQGYGLQVGSSYAGSNAANDSNGGNGWIILSEVMYVGPSACSGLPANVTCTNSGKYVYIMRLDFGNKSLQINGSGLASAIGSPSAATINSEGYVSNYLTDANAVAPYASNFITLTDTEVAYVAETFFSSPTLTFSAYPGGGITSRVFF